jgi:hypothetical protein
MSIQRLIEDVPSEEFFATLHYTKILELLGLEPPKRTGGFVKCVKCKTNSMLLSGVAPFGAWLYCDKCKTSCDAIKLYGLAYKIANPEDIIAQLKQDLKLKTINKAEISLYSNFYDTYYNKVQLIWEKAYKNMTPVAMPAGIGRLSELNLWNSQSVFNKGLSNWFGYMPKYELENLLDDSIPGLPKYAEGVLLMPFYIKPGFICGFGIVGPKDNLTYMNMFTDRICGFCGLTDSTLANTKETYVLPHPLQAARIRYKSCIENYDKICTVSKSTIGELDCTSLKGDSIVWVDDPEDSFLKTCIVSRGFKVLAEDTPYIWKPTEKASKLWQYNMMPAIHHELGKVKLQDPIDYLISELLSLGLGKARLVLEGMDLTELQKNVILAGCSDDIRQDMADLLEHAVHSQPIMIDRKSIFEHEGKLWIRGSREVADEMICDFLMRINHVCRNKQTGSGTLFGVISLADKDISFQADEDEFEEDPKRAVSAIAAAAGVSTQPYIADSIRKKYLGIVLRFSSPEVHSVQGYVGYDSDTGKFCTPKMCIDHEQIKVNMPFVMCPDPVPCDRVSMAPGDTIKTIKSLFPFSYETAAYFSAMAGVISSIYNNIEHNTRTNTMLVGSKGSLAEYIFDVIRMDLGLVLVSLNNKKDMEQAKELAIVHHVPVAIDGYKANPKLLAQWLEGQGGNSIVITHSLNAAALGKDKDWYFVRADIPVSGESKKLLYSEKAFPFLIQYMLTVRPRSAEIFLDNLTHLAKALDIPTETMEYSKALISSNGLINASSPAAHMINFIQEGVEAGLFKTFTGEGFKKPPVVLKNPMKDVVVVNLTTLLGQIRFFDLPNVSWETSVRHLKELGVREIATDGQTYLEFDKPLWNAVVTPIKRLRNMRKAFLNRLITVV